MVDGRIVYSSDGSHKLICKKCSEHPCKCPKASDLIPSNFTVKIRLEKKGRGGKTVTVVFNLPDNPDYFKPILKKLKSFCGTGGSYKNNTIEIQGDHKIKIGEFMTNLGFKVKFAGG